MIDLQELPTSEAETLHKSLALLWPQVRRRHLYPELPFPKLERSDSRAALEIRDKQIVLNLDYALAMSSKLPVETVLSGLLDHAISHYTCCPWDLNTHLRLYATAKELLGKADLANTVTDLFMDVVADTHAVKQRGSCLPELYRFSSRNDVEELVCALYEKIWGVELDARQHPEEVARLSTIPYLDKQKWRQSLRRFIRGIRPFLERAQESLTSEAVRMGSHSFGRYNQEEIEQALRQFALEARSPEQFADIFEDLQDQLQKGDPASKAGMGFGKGCPVDANWLYYMKLAENFSLPVKKLPFKDAGSLHPHSHRPWEVGQPIRDVDPWSSFGKYLPGLTQVWERRSGQVFAREERTPDCLVLIDSSGSMVDPRSQISYAVLGGGCAADSYLRHKAKVAVYNFSDAAAGAKEFLPFSSSRFLIYRVLCRYFGGGTVLNLDDLSDIIANPDVDIFMITDMQITNLDRTIARLSRLKNRVTAVHIGRKSGALRFVRAAVHNHNISVFGVEKASDIPRIVLGSVRSYLSHAT
ncbi:MAG: hypothetical protein JRJ12_15275 [Deltaproteobacteria bacterium]|nr:hypothetical protein [Deltaproteobacteria bacterium]MBW2072203.1 hypothetical protein [Deltaproteobacteria bacterium]